MSKMTVVVAFDRDVEWFGLSSDPLRCKWSRDHKVFFLRPPWYPELVDKSWRDDVDLRAWVYQCSCLVLLPMCWDPESFV